MISLELINVYCENICLSHKLHKTFENQDQYRLESILDYKALNDSKMTLKVSTLRPKSIYPTPLCIK